MDARAWLQAAGMKLGTIVTIDHPAIVEIARLAGFEWLWIDGEHGRFNEVSAAIACAVAAGGGPVFVRLPDRSPTAIKRFLDIGCDGIILPQVSSADEVDEIARAALYPPRGGRSVGIARAQGYGARFAECLEKQDYAIVVQIESVAGVKNAKAIVCHDAVDAVVIGPYDLSGSFGIPGQIDSPRWWKALPRCRRFAKRRANRAVFLQRRPAKRRLTQRQDSNSLQSAWTAAY